MNKEKNKIIKLERRRARVRAKISGTSDCPRLNVYKSNTGEFVQIIDDTKGRTLVSAHSSVLKEKGTKTEKAFALGKEIARKAIESKISGVKFDRGGNRYHGRVKAVAEGAREGGLQF